MEPKLFALIFLPCILLINSDKSLKSFNLSGRQRSTNHTTDEIPELSNDAIWQKIVSNPDSVTIPFCAYLHGGTGKIIISGKLDSTQQFFHLKYLAIKWDNGGSQKIALGKENLDWQKGQGLHYVILEDFNFDGRNDLSIFNNSGAVNFWYSTWLYSSNKLVFNSSISQISSPKVDTVHHQIISYFRFGGCQETVSYFKIVNNGAVPFKYVYNREEKGNDHGLRCITYQKELIAGAWKTKRLGEWDLEIYDSLYAQ